MFMFGSFVSCFFNSFNMTAFLTSACMLTHTLPSLFPLHIQFLDFLRLFNWTWCSCISSATFSVFRSFGVAYVFAQAHIFLQLVISLLLVFCFAYYFSVFELHLQTYLFQFRCIFFIRLRSFMITIFIEAFTWTISYLQ